MLAVSRKVSAMLVGTLGVMSSMPSWLGEAEVKSIVGGCPAMEETSRRNSKPQQAKGSPRQAGKSTAGFRSFSGLPVPTWISFFGSLFCFCFVFFVQGGVPAPQEPMEKLSSTGRSALDPFKHGCFYTGQPPDVPMALCFLSGCRLHWHAVASRC